MTVDGAAGIGGELWPFGVLGELEVDRGRTPIELGPPKQRAVLAMLMLSAGAVVSTDTLVAQLWGERPPRTAPHSVQTYVSGLRKALGTAGLGAGISTRRPGYRLDVDPGTIDAIRFDMLVRRGGRAVRDGDSTAGRADLRAALDTWRGPPLAEFAYEDWARPHVEQLQKLRLGAVEELAAAELGAGHLGEALRLAEQVTSADPHRERGQELAMFALYRSGRHVEAIRRYGAYRRMLVDDLGVVPSPALQRLHERMLLHDPGLQPEARPATTGDALHTRNPYMGLRPFGEDDAGDFFGREDLVEEVLARIRDGRRLVALVGPSGSGKSSVLAAGVTAALRAGAVDGSESWVLASMVPGAHPPAEAAAVLRRAAGDSGSSAPPGSGADLLGVRRFGSRAVLVVDQFEELFGSDDTVAPSRFLAAIADAVTDRSGQLTVILALRADHYDGPLHHPGFAAIFASSVVTVLPMRPDELAAAVGRPATNVGVTVEPALLAQLLTDTLGRPGSLPLLQYALRAQFDRTAGGVLALADYEQLGGLRAILVNNAESLYGSLDDEDQQIAVQILLRMVRVGRSGSSDSRRRVPVSELADLDLDAIGLSTVLDAFGRQRLISFDRDPITRAPTAELAHEALLAAWPRLNRWIDVRRRALGRLAAIRSIVDEWEGAGRDPDYLIAGHRLDELEADMRNGAVVMSAAERRFIVASLDEQKRREAENAARAANARRVDRRSRDRLLALAVVVAVLIGTLIYSFTRPGTATAVGDVVLLTNNGGELGLMLEQGYDRAVGKFGYPSRKVVLNETDPTSVDRSLGGTEPSVAVAGAIGVDNRGLALSHPRTRFITIDDVVDLPNVSSTVIDAREAAYLAGAAAAMSTTTGTIGFIGGVDEELIWDYQAGYEAGARSADPRVKIITRYLADAPQWNAGYSNPQAGERVARMMYADGADVVFAAAGESGLGVIEAATQVSSETGVQRWAIGVDADQYLTASEEFGGTGVSGSEAREHILTSVLKHLDVVVFDTLAAYAATDLRPGTVHLGLGAGAVDISYSGGFLDDVRPQLESLRSGVIDGSIVVPCRPATRLDDRTPERPHPCTG